jgi:hypothetical protein
MPIAINSSIAASADPNDFSVAVARKRLQAQADEGKAAVQLIEQASEVARPPAPSRGHRVDVYA